MQSYGVDLPNCNIFLGFSNHKMVRFMCAAPQEDKEPSSVVKWSQVRSKDAITTLDSRVICIDIGNLFDNQKYPVIVIITEKSINVYTTPNYSTSHLRGLYAE